MRAYMLRYAGDDEGQRRRIAKVSPHGGNVFNRWSIGDLAGRAGKARRRCPLAAAVLFTVMLGGCAHRVTPPADPADPVPVYLIDYGRHASLALPAGGRIEEWFWGDWNYYAAGNRSLGDGLTALFASRGATLGHRDHEGTADLARLCTSENAEHVFTFAVERAHVEALRVRLSAKYARPP